MTRRTALSLFLLCVLSAAPHHSAAAVSDTLKNACAEFLYPDMCLDMLEDDPRSATADLHGLALITLDLSVARANAINSSYAKQRGEPSHDAVSKNRLDSCLLIYQSNLFLLDYSRKFLAGGDLTVASGLLNQAGKVASECDGGINREDKTNLFNIILVASKFMEILSHQ